MNDDEKKAFEQIVQALENLLLPFCQTNAGTVLAVNVEGWIEQLATKIREEIK